MSPRGVALIMVVVPAVLLLGIYAILHGYFKFRTYRIYKLCHDPYLGRKMTLAISRDMQRKFWKWPLTSFLDEEHVAQAAVLRALEKSK